jgi:hypothetical protein
VRALIFFSYQFIAIVQEPVVSSSPIAEDDIDDDNKEKANSKSSGNFK